MPFKSNQICLKCETTDSPVWTNAESLGVICVNCVNEAKDNIKSEDEEEKEESKSRRWTRTTRSHKTRQNPRAAPKTTAPRGRGRRAIFKKTPLKAPSDTATTVTTDHVFFKVLNL